MTSRLLANLGDWLLPLPCGYYDTVQSMADSEENGGNSEGQKLRTSKILLNRALWLFKAAEIIQ